MPSIQTGSSSISGSGFALTGPAGNTGPIGETGNIGLLGITAGVTGATGVYIKQVTTSINPLSAGVYFYLSNGVTIGPISGFTGPSITYYNSKGISGSFASDYFNAFIGISGGMTFVFRGICGDGQYTRTSLSSDGTEIILTISDIPSGSVLLGTTSDDFITFTNSSYTATNSRIRVQNQLFEDNSSASTFKNISNYGILEFGLTANPDINPVSEVKTFVDFTTPFININGLNRNFIPGSVPITDGIKKVDSGGYVLDLDKSSVFKLTTPIGITAFSRKRADNQLRSWLFFIEGSDVWNFPQNVYFESGISGIENYAFGSGMNILRIETPMSGDLSNYNASFVDRFFGSDVLVDYGGIGSCCYSGGCDDYVTREYCEDVRSGTFNALISCENSCRVGSCCIGGTCHDTVSETGCTAAGGVWNAQTCSLRGPCGLYYILETVEPPVTTQNVVINNATSTDKKTVAIFRAKTNDSGVIIKQPKQYYDSDNGILNGLFFIKDISGNYDDPNNGEYTINNPTGTEGITFALQYDDSSDGVLDDFTYVPSDFVIQMKDSSGVVKTSLTYKVKAEYVSSCAGRPNSRLIKSEWLARRYCRDCYLQDVNTSVNYFYPVQSQYGSCDFCVDLQKVGSDYTITPVCITTSDVEDTNDCTNTTENDFSADSTVAATCKHSEWNIGSSINNCSGLCNTILNIPLQTGLSQTGCKGISLANQEKYPYWYNVSFDNISKLYGDLVSAGVTNDYDQQNIITYMTNFIENSNNIENEKAVLFTAENQNKGITFIAPVELASCCPAKDDNKINNTTLEFSDPDIRYFVIYTSYNSTGVCQGSFQDPKQAGVCRSRVFESHKYALIFKTYCISGTNTIDTSRPNCLVDIINTANTSYSCAFSTNSKCQATNCVYDRSSEYSIDNISEIKFTDTAPIAGSSNRSLILDRIITPKIGCDTSGFNYEWDLKDTQSWYTTDQQYQLIEAQLTQIFWYPMFCQECDNSVLVCDSNECRTVCFAENGSPFRDNTGAGANINCSIQPSPSDYRSISIQRTDDGFGNTIITPKIYGYDDITVVEKNNEYFYYMLGQPSDLTDNNTIYMSTCDDGREHFKIEKAQSGTPITIPTQSLQNSEFVVYYTDGQNIPFYNSIVTSCSADVRSAPVRIIKKYKDSNSNIPEFNFNADVVTDYGLGFFSVVVKTDCDSSNPECIPLDNDGTSYYIAGTDWKLSGWQVNYWYEYDGQIVNATSPVPPGAFIEGAALTLLNQTDADLIFFNKVPTTGYSNAGYVNIYITVTLLLISATDGSFRTVEKTKLVSVPRTPVSLTSSPRRLNKYKLITDENGNSQCVLMDCSVTTDCNTLPDC